MKLLKDYITLMQATKCLSINYAENKKIVAKTNASDESNKIKKQVKLYKANNLLESVFDLNIINNIIDNYTDIKLNATVSYKFTRPYNILSNRLPSNKTDSIFSYFSSNDPPKIKEGLIDEDDISMMYNIVRKTNFNKILCALMCFNIDDENIIPHYLKHNKAWVFCDSFIFKFKTYLNSLLKNNYKCSIYWNNLTSLQHYNTIMVNAEKEKLISNILKETRQYDKNKVHQNYVTELYIQFKNMEHKSICPLALKLAWAENDIYFTRNII